MFLEILTFVMFTLVIVLKYGVVSRIGRLSHRLWEVEEKHRRDEAYLKHQRKERRLAERDKAGLVRKEMALEAEAGRMEEELNALKESNQEILQQLQTKAVPDLLN